LAQTGDEPEAQGHEHSEAQTERGEEQQRHRDPHTEGRGEQRVGHTVTVSTCGSSASDTVGAALAAGSLVNANTATA
ncbi:MAG: hypothetical protein QOI44_919, partial [Actinomycetota bacterium]|nr:hypothetical protein [Actinomycetota bacterium]